MEWWFMIWCLSPEAMCKAFDGHVQSTAFYPTKAECIKEAEEAMDVIMETVKFPILWGGACLDNAITPRPSNLPGENT